MVIHRDIIPVRIVKDNYEAMFGRLFFNMEYKVMPPFTTTVKMVVVMFKKNLVILVVIFQKPP